VVTAKLRYETRDIARHSRHKFFISCLMPRFAGRRTFHRRDQCLGHFELAPQFGTRHRGAPTQGTLNALRLGRPIDRQEGVVNEERRQDETKAEAPRQRAGPQPEMQDFGHSHYFTTIDKTRYAVKRIRGDAFLYVTFQATSITFSGCSEQLFPLPRLQLPFDTGNKCGVASAANPATLA
jgi:hypothetical protein